MSAPLTLTPLTGMPEVRVGDALAPLLCDALARAGQRLAEGDLLVVSSKVVSKSLGLWAPAGEDRERVIASQTRRVVAERAVAEGRTTRVVHAAAGPVMAASGVDGSNTGDSDRLLLLPADPDQAARDLRAALRGIAPVQRLGLVLSDTAGRPWRSGQVDFALGAAGVLALDDLRGGSDADGRALHVTARAVADELAAAAELVMGKVDGIPAAVVRGLDVRGDGSGADIPIPEERDLFR